MARLDVINVHRHGSVRLGDPPIDFWPEGEEKLRPDPAVAAPSSQAVSDASGSRSGRRPWIADAFTAFIRRRCATSSGCTRSGRRCHARPAATSARVGRAVWYATRGSRVVTSTEDDENDDYYFDDEDGEYYYRTRSLKGDADEEVGNKTKKEKRKKPRQGCWRRR